MTVEPLVLSEHWPSLVAWWGAKKQPVPSMRHLPPTGIVVLRGAELLCAGFLFKTDARVGTIGHIVASPTVRGSLRNQALESLLMALLVEAKDSGCELVTAAAEESLGAHQERLVRLGFTPMDQKINHFGRTL